MKLSEILDSLKKKETPEVWSPKLWVPEPMESAISVYILSDRKFEIAAKSRGFNKHLGAFAVWGKDSNGEPVNKIYMRFHKLYLFPHEVRHLQKGHFHD